MIVVVAFANGSGQKYSTLHMCVTVVKIILFFDVLKKPNQFQALLFAVTNHWYLGETTGLFPIFQSRDHDIWLCIQSQTCTYLFHFVQKTCLHFQCTLQVYYQRYNIIVSLHLVIIESLSLKACSCCIIILLSFILLLESLLNRNYCYEILWVRIKLFSLNNGSGAFNHWW